MTDRMSSCWKVRGEYSQALSVIEGYEWPNADLLVRLLQSSEGESHYGLYVPTIPRPTSIHVGALSVKAQDHGVLEIRAIKCSEWVKPYLEALVKRLRQHNG